jgi:membrane protein required for colicin V production
LENINYFDIIVIALIIILGLKGLMRGFIKELFGLIGIVGGVFVASRLAKDAGEIIQGFIPMDNENTILLAGFIAALVLFWIVAYLLGMILEKVFEASGLGIFNRLFGFIFGAGKIFLLFSIIAYAVTGVKVVYGKLEPKLQNSIVFPILVDTGGYIIKLDTSKLQNKVKKQLGEAVDTTKKTIDEISTDEMQKKAKELEKQLKETITTQEK